MIEHLQNSPVVWTVLTICSLLTIPSLIFAIYTWIKGKQKKEFSVSKDGYCIVRKGKKKIEKVSVLFDGKEIDDLSVTKFVVWNSGNVDIRCDDIVSDRPLAIRNIGNATILDATIIVETDSSNKFSVINVDSETVMISFEYANKSDGIVVQVIHTGDWEDLIVDYKIKGGEPVKNYDSQEYFFKIIRNNSLMNRMITRNSMKKFTAGYLIFCSFTIIWIFIKMLMYKLNIYVDFISPQNKSYKYIDTGIDDIIIFGILSVFTLLVGLVCLKFVFKIGIPNKLKNYTKSKDDSNNV